MSSISPCRVPSLCQGCGQQGPRDLSISEIPPWCRCTGPSTGPYVAPPGVVVAFHFESRADADFREACRLVGKERFAARDALSERWVRCGSGVRELSRSHPKRKALEKRYRTALRAEEALQAVCRHPSRSIYFRIFCDVCHAQVECDVESFRHCVRELGKRQAMRLAI